MSLVWDLLEIKCLLMNGWNCNGISLLQGLKESLHLSMSKAQKCSYNSYMLVSFLCISYGCFQFITSSLWPCSLKWWNVVTGAFQQLMFFLGWKKTQKLVFETAFGNRRCTEQALQVPVLGVQWNCIACLCLYDSSWHADHWRCLSEFLCAFIFLHAMCSVILSSDISWIVFLMFLETNFISFLLLPPFKGQDESDPTKPPWLKGG